MFNIGEGFIEKQIKLLVKALTGFVYSKTLSSNIINQSGEITEENFLAYRLNKLISEGNINKAEDLLFAEIENYRSDANFKIALQFYEKLNEMDESTLNKHDFSKQEIMDGLNEIKTIYEDLDK